MGLHPVKVRLRGEIDRDNAEVMWDDLMAIDSGTTLQDTDGDLWLVLRVDDGITLVCVQDGVLLEATIIRDEGDWEEFKAEAAFSLRKGVPYAMTFTPQAGG